jgi:polysaccharide export outer membrane protein
MSLTVGLALAACASEPMSAAAAPPEGKPETFNQREYVLGVGDKIKITTFNEISLSGDFSVSPAGVISFPLVGAIQADGLTVAALETAIADKLRAGYLNDPRVSLEVLTYRPFYILGEVRNPGTYTYAPGLTVGRAVATANGYTYRANTKKVFIKHQGQNQELSYPAEGTEILPGDTVRIAERFF